MKKVFTFRFSKKIDRRSFVALSALDLLQHGRGDSDRHSIRHGTFYRHNLIWYQPPELGRVADYFTSTVPNKKLVVLVQDLHAHYGVQKNIAGLLEFLSDKLNASEHRSVGASETSFPTPPFALAVEGAEGPVRTLPCWRCFPIGRFGQIASDYLMRQGELTGVEYSDHARHSSSAIGVETLSTTNFIAIFFEKHWRIVSNWLEC